MNYIYTIKGIINYNINLKFELISVLQGISKPTAEWLSTDTEYFNMLAQEIDLTNAYTQELKEYLKSNLYFSDIALIINAIDVKDYLAQIDKFNKETINKITDLMNNFFNSLDLDTLYNKYSKFYQDNLKKVAEYYDNFNINKLKEFYNNEEYILNLHVSFISGNFGTNCQNNLFATVKFALDNLKVITSDSRINFIFHEFSHPYVSDVTRKHKKELDFINNHHKLIYTDKLYQYSNPYTLLDEILVRSNECYLALEYLGKEKLEKYINKQFQLGIFYFRKLADLVLEKYALYDNYEQFFLKEIIPFYQGLS